MAEVEEEKKELEAATPETPPAPVPETEEKAAVVDEEKSVISQPHLAPVEKKDNESKALVAVEKSQEVVEGKTEEEKPTEGSINRDTVLARVATEKRISLIKAWEENEKTKVENKAQKKLSAIGSWENSKKAAIEAELKQIEEKIEKQKAEYKEKMKNKIALLHKTAEEKKAIIEAKKGEDLLKAEETAAKYRATGTAPKKLFKFF